MNSEKIKAEEKALEKDKARLQNIEATAAKAEQNVEELIAQKKAELAATPAEKTVVKVTEEKPVSEKKSKKKLSDKWDINPLNWVRHIGTRALSGLA